MKRKQAKNEQPMPLQMLGVLIYLLIEMFAMLIPFMGVAFIIYLLIKIIR